MSLWAKINRRITAIWLMQMENRPTPNSCSLSTAKSTPLQVNLPEEMPRWIGALMPIICRGCP
jgi:hypothetical protein